MAGSVCALLCLSLLVLLADVALVKGYPSATADTDRSKLLQIPLPLQRSARSTIHRSVYSEEPLAITSPHAISTEMHLSSEDALQGDNANVRQVRATNATQLLDSVAEATDMEEPETKEPVADSQHFFPSFSPIFSPPLGHSRPPYFQEQTFSPRTPYKPHDSFGFGSGSFRDYSFPHVAAESERNANVLGSGNFGVIRGGTYYPGENDELLNDDIYNNYYHGNNGHGRPSFYPANPLPSFRQGGDFFANFKDFADISTPTKSSYSEFFVVYVNPNSTSNAEYHPDTSHGGSAPKNIFEQLQILDAADAMEEPEKKLSKTKLKLEKYKNQHHTKETNKKQQFRASTKEFYEPEPLLALS